MAIEDFIAARIYDDELEAEQLIADPPAEDSERAEEWAGVLVRWERALLECKAKRGILLDWMGQRRRAEVDRTIPGPSRLVLQYLALPYRDHPDYLATAWTPPEPGTVETWGRR
jgi:hypothetical protein